MKQYMLTVHTPQDGYENPPAPEVMQQMFEQVDAFNSEIMGNGTWVFGGGLEAPATATVVRAENGQVLLTDGPFAESKEQIGGFWVIRAEDLDAALAVAAKASAACLGPVEVRPFQAEPEPEA